MLPVLSPQISSSFSPKVLQLKSIPNIRELGGYVMNDGRHIRYGKLIRSGSLSKATDSDLTTLQTVYDVKNVFDYRTEAEQRKSPDRKISGARVFSLPCIDPDNDILSKSKFSSHAGRPGFLDFIVSYSFTEEAKEISRIMYSNLVMCEYTQLQYSTFLNYASSMQGDGAMLWHCSQGKDRTGLCAAFLLFILGASRQLIIDDFNYSNIVYESVITDTKNRIVSLGGKEDELDVVDSLVGANTRRFIQALDNIEKEYGSMNKYVTNQLCITESDAENIRNRFLI